MKSVFRWLASVFQVKVVWIEKGQGRWVRQRQYHPLLYIAVLAIILAAGVTAGKKYFQSEETEPFIASETSQKAVTPALPEPKIREFKMNEFFPVSIDAELSAALIPEGLRVSEDELWVRINKKQYKLYLYRGGNISRQYDIAVGRNGGNKQRRGDNRTPTGLFVVQSIENASSWSHDFRDGKGVIKGAYGPWFIRLKTGWQGIGIHGTHDPDSLGSMVSEGCIRMKNNEIEELKKVAFKNMKVLIEE